ncbi:MAG TPA: hypothetical protein VGM59_09500 [Dongiaceae bacterium]|jgi:hypothetical protein
MKTIHTVILALAIGLVPAAALAQSIGAPTSAAGGISSEPLSSPSGSRPSAVGPIGGGGMGGGGMGGDSIGSSSHSTSSGIRDLTPGTGKFETRGAPCIGSTGFGSSSVQPGHKC